MDKYYLNEKVEINQEYIKGVIEDMEKPVAGDNEKIFKAFFGDKYGEKILKGKCVYKDKKMNQQIINIDLFTCKRVKNKWIDIQYMIEYIVYQ